MNAWIGHYVYREDDMTKEEYKKLKQGDVVEHSITKSRYVVIEAKNAGEPLTQVKRDEVKNRITEFTIVMKRLPKRPRKIKA